MISQPTLGAQLVTIRKANHLTQEALAEKCHVSVRTIQRIESGEVTPRHSTVRLLLSVMAYDEVEWDRMSRKENKNHSSIFKTLKHMFAMNLPTQGAQKMLTAAWIAGAVYLISGVLDVTAEVFLATEGLMLSGKMTYAGIKVLAAVSFFIFFRGFAILGALFQNQLVRIGAYLFMFSVAVMYLGNVVLIFSFPDHGLLRDAYDISFMVTFGVIGLIFGIGMLRLQDGMGELAKAVGVLEIIMGATFLSIILAFIGLVLFVPVTVVEIILLAKAAELAQKGSI